MKIKISPLIACLIGLLRAFTAADTVFVSNEKSNTISVLNSQTMQQTAEFKAGNRPRGITVSPDGTRLNVCASDDDTVRVFDTSSYKSLYSLPSGPDPELAKLHPSGNPLYVSNEDDNLVTVVDVKLRPIIAKIPVGRIGTAYDIGYAYLFLASREAGFISAFTLHVNGGALAILKKKFTIR